jgi:DNA-entry nuclease
MKINKKHTINNRIVTALVVAFVLVFGLSATGCSSDYPTDKSETSASSKLAAKADQKAIKKAGEEALAKADTADGQAAETSKNSAIQLDSIPAYSGSPYVEINGNVPFFTDADSTTAAFETYSDLDSIGRCGSAYANICKEIMPTERRGYIGAVRPSGWHTVKYAGIDGNYLYNRCHLIGYQLAGENANEKNLITGTRYLNVDGMLPFEDKVADYVESTEHHVLYRVTPVFDGNNLLANGVLMEAKSVEDNNLRFCVYCYNVQPGITISYVDGGSSGPEYTGSGKAGTGNSVTGNGSAGSTGTDSGTQAQQITPVPSGQSANNANDPIVYWTPNGKSYHSTPKCPTLGRSKNICSGPLSQCPKTDPCNRCEDSN